MIVIIIKMDSSQSTFPVYNFNTFLEMVYTFYKHKN